VLRKIFKKSNEELKAQRCKKPAQVRSYRRLALFNETSTQMAVSNPRGMDERKMSSKLAPPGSSFTTIKISTSSTF